MLPEPVLGGALMPVVAIGMQEADSGRGDAVAVNGISDGGLQFPAQRERHLLRSVNPHSAINLETKVARYNGYGKLNTKVEQIVAALHGDIERVAEPACHEHQRRGS